MTTIKKSLEELEEINPSFNSSNKIETLEYLIELYSKQYANWILKNNNVFIDIDYEDNNLWEKFKKENDL